MVCACATRFFLFCEARQVKTYSPDLWLYPPHPKLVTILPDLTQRTVPIRSHWTNVWGRPSILLASQPVTMKTARKVREKEVRTAPQAEESWASSYQEGRSRIQSLWTAAVAKKFQLRSTTAWWICHCDVFWVLSSSVFAKLPWFFLIVYFYRWRPHIPNALRLKLLLI
jgi:hypothetical protein